MKIHSSRPHEPEKPAYKKGDIARATLATSEVVNSSIRPLIDTFSSKKEKFLRTEVPSKKKADHRGGGGLPDKATKALNKTDKFTSALFKGKEMRLSPQTVVHKKG